MLGAFRVELSFAGKNMGVLVDMAEGAGLV